MTQREPKEPIPLERLDREVVDCCGTCEHAIWVMRSRFRACDQWNARLTYPNREQLTRQRCWAHRYSESANAVELRVALEMRGAHIADTSRVRPANVAEVPLLERAAPAKGLVDTQKKIGKLTDDEIREIGRAHV